MFSGHGIYLGNDFVAIILREKLYLKANLLTRHEFELRGLKPLVFKMRNKSGTFDAKYGYSSLLDHHSILDYDLPVSIWISSRSKAHVESKEAQT